jgi:hypothetical protein
MTFLRLRGSFSAASAVETAHCRDGGLYINVPRLSWYHPSIDAAAKHNQTKPACRSWSAANSKQTIQTNLSIQKKKLFRQRSTDPTSVSGGFAGAAMDAGVWFVLVIIAAGACTNAIVRPVARRELPRRASPAPPRRHLIDRSAPAPARAARKPADGAAAATRCRATDRVPLCSAETAGRTSHGNARTPAGTMLPGRGRACLPTPRIG